MENSIECLVFAKKRTTEGGKTFHVYLTSLTNKTTGEVLKGVQVKFKKDLKSLEPSACPCYVEIAKEGSNLSYELYTREDTGEECKRYILWVSGYTVIPDKVFVDHSLDDF